MSVKLRLDPRASLDDTEGPMTSGKGVYAATWLGRSSSPRNEPGDARVHNRIEPDSRTDPLTNFLAVPATGRRAPSTPAVLARVIEESAAAGVGTFLHAGEIATTEQGGISRRS
jgi:hypothetical protein